METRIIKTFPIKMKEDVGMSKPKKHANKVRWDPKLNKPLPYNPTIIIIIIVISKKLDTLCIQ